MIMNIISYIESNLNRISELGTLEKFDLLLSSTNAINQKDLYNPRWLGFDEHSRY